MKEIKQRGPAYQLAMVGFQLSGLAMGHTLRLTLLATEKALKFRKR